MPANFFAPSTSTTPVFITDTYDLEGGSIDNIPTFPTKDVGGKQVPLSAALLVSSISGGVGFPEMTQAQINALPAPFNGMMIYNSTTNTYDGYAAGAFTSFATEGGATGAYTPGNPLYLYGNNTGGDFCVASPVVATGYTLPNGTTVFGATDLLANQGPDEFLVGINNNAFGLNALQNTILGVSNCAFGSYAGLSNEVTANNVLGSNNCFFGNSSGATGNITTYYAGCVFVGFESDAIPNATASNITVAGNLSKGQENSCVFGANSVSNGLGGIVIGTGSTMGNGEYSSIWGANTTVGDGNFNTFVIGSGLTIAPNLNSSENAFLLVGNNIVGPGNASTFLMGLNNSTPIYALDIATTTFGDNGNYKDVSAIKLPQVGATFTGGTGPNTGIIYIQGGNLFFQFNDNAPINLSA